MRTCTPVILKNDRASIGREVQKIDSVVAQCRRLREACLSTRLGIQRDYFSIKRELLRSKSNHLPVTGKRRLNITPAPNCERMRWTICTAVCQGKRHFPKRKVFAWLRI